MSKFESYVVDVNRPLNGPLFDVSALLIPRSLVLVHFIIEEHINDARIMEQI